MHRPLTRLLFRSSAGLAACRIAIDDPRNDVVTLSASEQPANNCPSIGSATSNLPGVDLATDKSIDKYWNRRYEYFSNFDSGIHIDKEGLYSCTPEMHALKVGFSLPPDVSVVIDAFCGVGGNSIGFARSGKRVVAIDNDASRLAMARHNASLHGVEDRITFVHGNVLEYLESTKKDQKGTIEKVAIHFDPPWGGPAYSKSSSKFKLSHFAVDGRALIRAGLDTGCKQIIFKVPKSFDLNEITSGFNDDKEGADLNLSFTLTRMMQSDPKIERDSYWVLDIWPSPNTRPPVVN